MDHFLCPLPIKAHSPYLNIQKNKTEYQIMEDLERIKEIIKWFGLDVIIIPIYFPGKGAAFWKYLKSLRKKKPKGCK